LFLGRHKLVVETPKYEVVDAGDWIAAIVQSERGHRQKDEKRKIGQRVRDELGRRTSHRVAYLQNTAAVTSVIVNMREESNDILRRRVHRKGSIIRAVHFSVSWQRRALLLFYISR
jgi:hypothetical protein